MLILTRYPSQVIFINTPSGDEITITNLGVNTSTKQVRIGIKAPEEYKIVREELVDKPMKGGQSRPPRVFSSPTNR